MVQLYHIFCFSELRNLFLSLQDPIIHMQFAKSSVSLGRCCSIPLICCSWSVVNEQLGSWPLFVWKQVVHLRICHVLRWRFYQLTRLLNVF